MDADELAIARLLVSHLVTGDDPAGVRLHADPHAETVFRVVNDPPTSDEYEIAIVVRRRAPVKR